MLLPFLCKVFPMVGIICHTERPHKDHIVPTLLPVWDANPRRNQCRN
jgi:hypothetical protein